MDMHSINIIRFKLRHLQSEYLRRQRCSAAAPYIHGAILDLGCDAADLLRYITNKSEYTGVDIRKEAVDAMNINFPESSFYCVDICRNDQLINRIQSRFDTIVLLATIEHLQEPIVTLNQCYKMLKDGGTLIVTTPTSKGDKMMQFVQSRVWFMSQGESPHLRTYNERDLRQLFQQCGFSVELYKRFVFGLNQLIIGSMKA
ncbi:MAG: class I SAM-dependent methyltransferase [Dehalococcoidia bacterium]|jgi:2-polyprenyl-3-methyl-5-hydroxy-6-metoxy-1,4-benzoquinol methylase